MGGARLAKGCCRLEFTVSGDKALIVSRRAKFDVSDMFLRPPQLSGERVWGHLPVQTF